jgi:hypothetical protein
MMSRHAKSRKPCSNHPFGKAHNTNGINTLGIVPHELSSIFAGSSFTIKLRLIFRVPSQYKHLRLTQRVTCLLKNPESFSATSKKKEIATTWKQEQ